VNGVHADIYGARAILRTILLESANLCNNELLDQVRRKVLEHKDHPILNRCRGRLAEPPIFQVPSTANCSMSMGVEINGNTRKTYRSVVLLASQRIGLLSLSE